MTAAKEARACERSGGRPFHLAVNRRRRKRRTLPERWSAQRKTELVLRLLRGEALDAVSRESQVPAQDRGIDDAARVGRVPHWKKGLRRGMEEVQAVRGRVSPGTQHRYPLTMICEAFGAPQSSVYAAVGSPGVFRPRS
jgi:hypothetical protein